MKHIKYMGKAKILAFDGQFKLIEVNVDNEGKYL